MYYIVRAGDRPSLVVWVSTLAPVDRNVEGVVEMVLDAATNNRVPVTREGAALAMGCMIYRKDPFRASGITPAQQSLCVY